MKTIAILLTVHNRREKTLRCLHNLFGQEVPEGFETDVFLTDDGCTDGTPEAIRAQYPQVHIVQGDGTLFWNRGMYKAWEAAAKAKDYDFYLWLNDDTFVYPDLYKNLLSASKKNGDKTIIVGATQSSDHKHATYGGRLSNNAIPVPNGETVEANYFNGNIVLIPKFIFKAVGNLDFYFTHSKGDFDYGLRAKRKGIKIIQVGKYLGECDLHEHLDRWCDPVVPFLQRWKALHRPTGMPPKETFHIEKRHRDIITAAFHCCTIYLRCLFPNIWIWLNKTRLP